MSDDLLAVHRDQGEGQGAGRAELVDEKRFRAIGLLDPGEGGGGDGTDEIDVLGLLPADLNCSHGPESSDSRTSHPAAPPAQPPPDMRGH